MRRSRIVPTGGAVLAVFMTVVFACTKTISVATPLGVYELIEVQPEKDPVAGNKYLPFVLFTKNSIVIDDNCGGGGGPFKVDKNGKWSFPDGITIAAIACENAATGKSATGLSDQMLQMIGSSPDVTIKGDRMTLVSTDPDVSVTSMTFRRLCRRACDEIWTKIRLRE